MQKKKILAICDHPLSVSGVGTQSRFLIEGLAATGRYTFRVLGAGVKHRDYRQIQHTPDIVIKPVDGFGDMVKGHDGVMRSGDLTIVRNLLVSEKPDALFLFTDPRMFSHIWTMEDEIHQVCPIVYNTIWDSADFAPDYNRYVYDSCDLLHCINHPTYKFVSEWFPEKTHYTPHAVPKTIYKPLSHDVVKSFKRSVLGEDRHDHFTMLYVSRNARRKRTPDIMWAFKMFLEELERKHGHKKATLLMHVNPLDPEGPNLYSLTERLDIRKNVVFSKDMIKFPEMAILYNMSDCLVNVSTAEGFGLPVLEMKMCGRPVIALKTGGLTRQVQDHESEQQFGIALDVEIKSLVGNMAVPYITEDYCSVQTVAKAYMTMFEYGPDVRAEIGKRAMEHAHKNYDLDALIKSWDETLTETMENWRARRPRWKQIEL